MGHLFQYWFAQVGSELVNPAFYMFDCRPLDLSLPEVADRLRYGLHQLLFRRHSLTSRIRLTKSGNHQDLRMRPNFGNDITEQWAANNNCTWPYGTLKPKPCHFDRIAEPEQ